MGRGLSQLQKDILGLAFTVNAHTQGGRPSAKIGQPLDGYRLPTSDYRGPADYTTPIGVYAIYGMSPAVEVIRWTRRGPVPQGIGRDCFFANTPEVKRAKAAASRAVSRLVSRRLLVYRPSYKGGWNHPEHLGSYGYLLTPAGMEIGRDNPLPVPLIEDALRVFHVTATTRESWSVPGVAYINERDLMKVRLALSKITVSVNRMTMEPC